jgi:hypothetical protein
MKRYFLTSLVFLSFFITSCEDEELSWVLKKEQLIGPWQALVTSTKLLKGEQVVKTKEVTLEFINLDEVFIQDNSNGFTFTTTTNWYYQVEPEYIIFQYSSPFTESNYFFKVIENSANKQLWETSYVTYELIPGDTIYSAVRVTESWDLKKI